MSDLQKQIQDAVISTMKSGDKERLKIIRLMTSAMKQIEVDERIELDDARIIAILDKMVKQRRESISQFKTAGRDDLVKQESFEIDIIQEFLPQALSEEEVDAIVKAAIEQTGASSIKDMGKVMGLVKPQIIGRADMGEVSGRIKSTLSSN
ncbi:MAG: GatB/YqeY domain-containing protein [Gammaproteobacteria bacterium]|nr:GatB/YqeY domain-containing protein [Gammaproteobacteria bacterium]